MQIISTELRLKDIEWVEKELEKLKKVTRGLGSISLADKAKKEEQVSLCHGRQAMERTSANDRLPSRRFLNGSLLRTKMSERVHGPTRM
jgi:ribosome-binding ATPase YchF (GTP1/OBG family)